MNVIKRFDRIHTCLAQKGKREGENQYTQVAIFKEVAHFIACMWCSKTNPIL